MLELHITDKDITGGSIPITWCIDKELVEYFAKNKIDDPLIVFCLSPDEDYSIAKEIRKIVPLSDLMTYLDFKAPGNHTIHAFITIRPRRDAREKYLVKDNGEYYSNILDDDGTGFGQFVSSIPEIDLLKAAPVSISIPQECFAEPAWDRTWVNHFFSKKPDNQCSYRKRRLFAYLVQPFLVVGILLTRLFVMLLAFLYLSRGLTFKYLLHPLTYDWEDSQTLLKGGSYLVPHLPEDDKDEAEHPMHGDAFLPAIYYIVRKIGLLIFAPIVIVPVFLLWYYHRLLLGAEIAGGVLLSAIVVIGLIALCIEHNYVKVWVWFGDLLDQRLRTKPIWDQGKVQNLICDGNPKPPVKKFTIHLFYQGVKNKVCKPFAK